MSTLQTINIKHPSASTPTITFISSTNQATINAGSASAPVLSFIGDENTGLWSPAADTVAFSTGGVERLRITSTGSLAIGTTTTATQVTVAATGFSLDVQRFTATGSAGPGLEMKKSSSGTVGTQSAVASGDLIGRLTFMGSDGTDFRNSSAIQGEVDAAVSSNVVPGRLVFRTATAAGSLTERMRIDSSGNIGIGTTSPATKLHVLNTTAVDTEIRVGNSNSYNSLITNSGGSGTISFPSGTLTFSDGTERMRITSAGGIAIGDTTASGAKLKIGNGSDNAYILQHGSANFVGISIRNVQSTTSANSTSYIDTQNENFIADGHLFFVHETDGSSTFLVGTTPAGSKSSDRRVERLRVTGDGNVGIGTSSPGALLHLTGNELTHDRFSSDNAAPSLLSRKSRGTSTSPSAVLVDDFLSAFCARGYGTSAFGTTNVGLSGFQADENFTDTAQGTRFVVGTTPIGSTTRSERMRINNAGLITGTGTSLGAWTAYTPTLGGTGWAIGNGTISAAYCQIGKIVVFRVKITFGSTSTYGASVNPTITLPVTTASGKTLNGSLSSIFFDQSTGISYTGTSIFDSTTVVSPRRLGTNGEHGSVLSTLPFTWTTSDELGIQGTYEIA